MAQSKVMIIEKNTIIVATKRFAANMFLNCLRGPIRKHVLKDDREGFDKKLSNLYE